MTLKEAITIIEDEMKSSLTHTRYAALKWALDIIRKISDEK